MVGSSPITGPVLFDSDGEPVTPYAVTRDGHVIPAAEYDKTQHQAYVGPHHPCTRCLTHLIPAPEAYCSFCLTPIQPAEATG